MPKTEKRNLQPAQPKLSINAWEFPARCRSCYWPVAGAASTAKVAEAAWWLASQTSGKERPQTTCDTPDGAWSEYNETCFLYSNRYSRVSGFNFAVCFFVVRMEKMRFCAFFVWAYWKITKWDIQNTDKSKINFKSVCNVQLKPQNTLSGQQNHRCRDLPCVLNFFLYYNEEKKYIKCTGLRNYQKVEQNASYKSRFYKITRSIFCDPKPHCASYCKFLTNIYQGNMKPPKQASTCNGKLCRRAMWEIVSTGSKIACNATKFTFEFQTLYKNLP